MKLGALFAGNPIRWAVLAHSDRLEDMPAGMLGQLPPAVRCARWLLPGSMSGCCGRQNLPLFDHGTSVQTRGKCCAI